MALIPWLTVEYRKWLQDAIVQADTIKLFEFMLTIGVEEWASDIHVEPFENFGRIRIRIDGWLEELMQYPKTIHESIIAKFKIESWQMRPDEKRIPQDARVSTITLTNKEIDLRASTLPTIWWEKLVMRIVDKSKKTPKLQDLWIEWTNNEMIMRQLEYPNGIVLNTWPTGSGKTATLYAALDYVNKIDVNIITYEDPVENKMMWLSQSQVRADIWYTFASGLRAALRQDPDIIMVWEIRDKETLDMAMEAAMTWHLVFSTIHTNSSAETITRVMNLWAKAYMIAGTFNFVMAQRLIRKVCSKCNSYVDVSQEKRYGFAKDTLMKMNKEILAWELKKRGVDQLQWQNFLQWKIKIGWWKDEHGETCPICNGSGYKWRVGIFEVMEYTDDIKKLLIDGKTAFDVEKFALDKGMMNLERDWIFKIVSGKTTLDELYTTVTHKL
jgi:type IV pilus assembly protein PilB